MRKLKKLSRAKPVRQLNTEEKALLVELLDLWREKQPRNKLRQKYFDNKNALKDLGIAIPEPLLGLLEVAVGWPSKAVRHLGVRSVFDGFAFKDSPSLKQEMFNTLSENSFRTLYSQLVTSQLIHSCAFLTVSRGGRGEPDVLVNLYSAEDAAAIWCRRTKRIHAGITVTSIDEEKGSAKINLYLHNQTIQIEVSDSGAWVRNRVPHRTGRPHMEAFAFEPSAKRPFGYSRISRTVMSLTDAAVRSVFRSEVAAEFFCSPKRYILGISDPNERERLAEFIGTYMALDVNAEGENPVVGQLTPTGVQEHIAQRRDLAAQFSGETYVPLSSLGVIHDNPSSAEAIHAAREDLILAAEGLNDVNGQSLRNVGLMIMAIKNNTSIARLTSEQLSITPRFKNPARPSITGMADSISKLAKAFPDLAYSDVFLKRAGFTEAEIMLMRPSIEQASQKNIASSLDRFFEDLLSGDFNAESQ